MNQDNIDIQEVLQEKEQKKKDEKYNAYVLFTGLNLYQKLANFAGAGTIVPITGFANSVAAPAIEFKEEGWVFGVGCKIFTIAGPVILYGVFCSWVLGVIYWVW